MASASGTDTTRRLADAITKWLELGGSSFQLFDWLRGYDLPVAGGGEPYLWLARGLESLGDLRATEGKFCERVKAALESRPDQELEGPWPERVLYNLYMLCACLHCPTCLAEPLLAIYKDRPDHGRWHDLEPREALRIALVENQLDTTLHDDWKALLIGRHDYLPGDPEAGFDGVLKMHPSRDSLDKPVINAVLDAFDTMIHYLEDEKDHIERLRELLNGAEEIYPDACWDILLSERQRTRWKVKENASRERWVAIVLTDKLNDNEIIETRKAGRKRPRDAQDVKPVRLRSEKKRELISNLGASGL